MEPLYKLENGQLMIAPKNYYSDTESILNFPSVAHNFGYKPLILDTVPPYNEEYQQLTITYTETDTNIVQSCKVIENVSLDEYKQRRISQLDTLREERVATQFTSQGYIFSYDKKAQENFGKVSALMNAFPNKAYTEWKTLSHGIVSLTREHFFQALADAELHEMSKWGDYWSYEHQVSMAQTHEEVYSVGRSDA